MDALLKALEERGYSAGVSKQEQISTHLLIGTEKVKVRMWENSIRSERELTILEKKKPDYLQPNKWVYNPSGKLTFVIDEYIDGYQKMWTDRIKKPLEEQLNEILTTLILIGDALRLEHIKREEEHRRWCEQERRREEEQQRRNYLDQHFKEWSQCERLREFLHACEKSLIERKGEIASDSPESKWLSWAHQYTDRIDPLKNGSFEEAILSLFSKTKTS
jgi:hypothetical protein